MSQATARPHSRRTDVQLHMELPSLPEQRDEPDDLSSYDLIVLNTSGGKDSQTMVRLVADRARAENVPSERLIAVHADLGRAEWPGTGELARTQAETAGVTFLSVTRPQGDLLEHVERRGMWPSPAARYCTSDRAPR